MPRTAAAEPGVRRPAVAGIFYPADPARLAATVDRLLGEAPPGTRDGRRPKAIVAPHAGYVYSGAVAAAAWAAARAAAPASPLARVVIAGPAHFVALRGACVPAARRWRVPTGEIEIEEELRDVAARAGARVDDRPHEPEHSLEVQLPFLLRIAPPGVRLLPIAVGESPSVATAELLGRLGDGADLLVVSTDLSHEHEEAAARRLDRRTIDAILARNPDAIDHRAACGLSALRGLVELARQRDWPVRLIDRRTSADAGGPTDRVVGYAALALG